MPNKIVMLSLQALEEVMGKNGLNAILNLANLKDLIDNYPPDNLKREFDFADFSAINGGFGRDVWPAWWSRFSVARRPPCF